MSATLRYRKREPIEVEAALLTINNIAEVAQWCGGRIIQSTYYTPEAYVELGQPVGIKFQSSRRLQVVMLGEYIYKDHEGLFNKMDLNEFVFEYEPITDGADVVAENKENNE